MWQPCLIAIIVSVNKITLDMVLVNWKEPELAKISLTSLPGPLLISHELCCGPGQGHRSLFTVLRIAKKNLKSYSKSYDGCMICRNRLDDSIDSGEHMWHPHHLKDNAKYTTREIKLQCCSGRRGWTNKQNENDPECFFKCKGHN